jgi:hypothetical protein
MAATNKAYGLTVLCTHQYDIYNQGWKTRYLCQVVEYFAMKYSAKHSEDDMTLIINFINTNSQSEPNVYR